MAASRLVCLTVAPAAVTAAALDRLAPEARLVWSVKGDPDAYPEALVARLLRRADVIALSEGERPFLARHAAGRRPREDALVLETRGPRDVTWRRGGDGGHVAVEPLAVTDTTGAGDAFVAGVIAELRRDDNDPVAAVAGGIAASRALLQSRQQDEVAG